MVASAEEDAVVGRRQFVTTRWSLVQAAAAGFGQRPEALESLCVTYWHPLYAFAVRRGWAEHDAEDLTQAFFAEFLSRDYCGAADRTRGRFRTFLLTAFRHFIDRHWRWQRRHKRGGEVPPVPLGSGVNKKGEAIGIQVVDRRASPETEYDRQWGLTVLSAGLDELRRDYCREGRGDWFDGLSPFLSVHAKPGDYERLAVEFGVASGTVAVAVHRMRQRYAAFTLAEVAKTVSDPSDARDELRYLVRLVTAAPNREAEAVEDEVVS